MSEPQWPFRHSGAWERARQQDDAAVRPGGALDPAGEAQTVVDEVLPPPSVEVMLERIPQHIVIDPDVDLDDPDPALTPRGRRLCISTRRAGGRCTASAIRDGLLCSIHAGIVDPSAGGQALARLRREARTTEEDRARLGRLGTRGVIADTLAREATKVRLTVELLLTAGAEGDLAAAKALIPWINQGLGLPSERIEVESVSSSDEVAGLDTASLQALVASRRSQAAASAQR